MQGITRRSFLAASASAVVLGACTSDKGSAPAPTPASSSGAPDFTMVTFTDTSAITAGAPQRLTFGIADGEGVFIDAVPDSMTFDIVLEGQASTAGSAVTAQKHNSGLPKPYFPIEFTPPEPGNYTIVSSVNGTPVQVTVPIPATTEVISTGQQMVPLDTPTTDDPRGVKLLCTRSPACPLHDITLREALTLGQPVAFLVATPLYCQTAICGPVLDVLLAQKDQFPQIKMLHAEVYPSDADAQPPNQKVTEAVSAYHLSFEPVLYLARPDGTIMKRVDTIFDGVELHEALTQLIS